MSKFLSNNNKLSQRVKSRAKFNLLGANDTIDAIINSALNSKAILRYFMKETVSFNCKICIVFKFPSNYIDSFSRRFPPQIALTTVLEPTTEVNIEVIIPIDNVTAKPLTGPVPTANKINAAIKVVILASIMVEKAAS